MSALLDTGQIASMLGVSREYIATRLAKQPGFPAPLAIKTRDNKVWRRSEVLSWFSPCGGLNDVEVPPPVADDPDGPEAAPTTMHEHLLALARNARKRSARRGLQYGLPDRAVHTLFDQQRGRCAVSGMEFTLDKFGAITAPFAPSLDRIENAKGYEPGNVRLVCCAVNYLMNHWGDQVYAALAAHIKGQ
jgi:predicted DNA-binding transcriptional regulator AlpA